MVFGEVVSYASNDTYSVLYGIVFIGVFFCMRLVVQEIGLPNVLRAYSQAGFVTATLILVFGRQALLASEPGRFSGGTRAHPNLLSFILAGFLPVIVWRAMEEKERWRKRALILLSMITFVLMFMTGSRGSLSAVLIAAIALLARTVAQWTAAQISDEPSPHHCFPDHDSVGGDVPCSAQPDRSLRGFSY